MALIEIDGLPIKTEGLNYPFQSWTGWCDTNESFGKAVRHSKNGGSPLSISSKEFVVCDFVSRLWNNYTSLTGGES